MARQYEVQKILKKRINNEGKPEYLIKWMGYPESEATWEPRQHLLNIQDFLQEYDDKINKCASGTKTHQIGKKQNQRTVKAKKSKEHALSNLLKSKRIASTKESQAIIRSAFEGVANQKRAYKRKVSRTDQEALDNKFQQISPQSPRQNSINNSDHSEGAEIVDMRIHNQNRYFRVRSASSIEWKSSEQVKVKYALELIEFYQRHIFPEQEE